MDETKPNNKTTGQPDNLDVIPLPTHPTKTVKTLNRLVVVSLIATAIALGVFIKWSVAKTDILIVKNSPFPARIVPDPTGKTGGIVFLTVDYCKNDGEIGKMRMSYVSASREVFVPVVDERVYKGCHNEELPVVIPLNLLKDEYKIKFHVVYNINPLKNTVFVDFESQKFTVGTGDVNK